MIPKVVVLALSGTLTVWSIGCQSEADVSNEEPGSPPAQNEPGSPHEPGSPPDTKGESGAHGEKGSTQREPGS